MQTVILLVVFISIIWLLLGMYLFANRRRLTMAEAARAQLTPTMAPIQTAILRDESFSELPLLNRLLTGRDLTGRIATQLRQAGSTLNPGSFVLIVAVSAAAGFLIGSRYDILGMVAGTAVGVALPFAWLKRRQSKRLSAFEEQLPEAIDMLVSAMKSGYSFHSATNFLGQELAAPLGSEFARVYDEQRLGIDTRTALLNLQERVGSIDIRMFVTALLIQRETGGNLSEVLTNAADMMRGRAAVRGHLKTLTAEAVMSARLLAMLPVGVFFGLSYIVPDFTQPFVASRVGQMMLIGAGLSVVIGYMIMMKIADIDF
ncbi:MAG: type II secretion system F family protein [Gemmatimonadaceae bacterium]